MTTSTVTLSPGRKFSPSETIRIRGVAEQNAAAVLQRLLANYDTDRDHIADSDLDNEQPITITFRGTLNDIRSARTALSCYLALREGK